MWPSHVPLELQNCELCLIKAAHNAVFLLPKAISCRGAFLSSSLHGGARGVNAWLWIAGVLLDKTDSWSVIFGTVAVVYALGFAGFAALGSGELQNYDDWQCHIRQKHTVLANSNFVNNIRVSSVQ